MRAEYDFSGGVRGKHAAAFREGVSVRVVSDELEGRVASLDAEVAALRKLVRAMERRLNGPRAGSLKGAGTRRRKAG